ncbi:MAG: hypothetical protein LUJ09_04190 [Firmicutes bacterium]|nr:hypothetical protein [Bacillota bacterium]
MAKEKKPDRLALKASAALAAGMSYGQWVAAGGTIQMDEPEQKQEAPGRICTDCGARFYGGSRTLYCPECRHKRYLESARRTRERRRERKINGSIA